MAINGTLKLDTSYYQNGLGTLTFTVPTTVSSLLTPVVNIPFSVQCQCTVPSTTATGAGSGTGVDQGLGATGGFPGSTAALQTLSNGQMGLGTSFPNVPANSAPGVNPTTMPETTPNLPPITAGNGARGLGFGGSENDNATGTGNGHGAGAGGTFGYGFGPAVGVQPPANVITPTTVAGEASGVTIVVKQNGSTIYTAPAFTPTQLSVQFKTTFLANANDSITVVFASSTQSDEQLQGVSAQVSVQQGS
jgi:hypothetical protein